MADPPGSSGSDLALLLRLRTRQLALATLLDTERNLGRAASALSISQPAASKLLQQMEDTLGVRLFERLSRGMMPTPSGEVLVRYARSVLTDFAATRDEMAAIGSGLRGTLRLGCVAGAVPGLLADVLREYKERHPRVALSITVSTSDRVIEQLADGEFDLVLGRLPNQGLSDDYRIVPLLDEQQVVVVRANHPLTLRSRITLDDLIGFALILQPAGSPQRTLFDSLLRDAGITRSLNITETASTIVTTSLLEASDMVAIMPSSVAAHYGRLGILCSLSMTTVLRVPPIGLITRRGRQPTAAVTRFLRLLRSRSGGRILAVQGSASPG
jgi:DNA-binding transcriptional LysR family regulator